MITQKEIEEIVKRIVTSYKPEKILLCCYAQLVAFGDKKYKLRIGRK
jgi:hypothetical protein